MPRYIAGVLENQTGLLDDALATFDHGLELHRGDLNLISWKVNLLAQQDRRAEVGQTAEVVAPPGDADALIGRLAAGLMMGSSETDERLARLNGAGQRRNGGRRALVTQEVSWPSTEPAA